MKHLRAFLMGFALFVAGSATAGSFSLFGSGPVDVSQIVPQLNAQLTNWIAFNQTPAELGELSFSSGVITSSTSIAIIMPNGAARYIQTSATP